MTRARQGQSTLLVMWLSFGVTTVFFVPVVWGQLGDAAAGSAAVSTYLHAPAHAAPRSRG
jgi:hypothetical protein